MNLHIDFMPENYEAVADFKFGSVLHGQNNPLDTDIMTIYVPSILETTTPFQNHHVFQYTSGNEDRIFLTPQKFFAGIANGDSLVNYDVFMNYRRYSDNFLYYVRDVNFHTKKLYRALIGFTKKDIKKYKKEKDPHVKDRLLSYIRRQYRLLLYLTPLDRLSIESTKLMFCADDDFYQVINNMTIMRNDINNFDIPDYLSVEDQMKLGRLCADIGTVGANSFDDLSQAIYDTNVNPEIDYSGLYTMDSIDAQFNPVSQKIDIRKIKPEL